MIRLELLVRAVPQSEPAPGHLHQGGISRGGKITLCVEGRGVGVGSSS